MQKRTCHRPEHRDQKGIIPSAGDRAGHVHQIATCGVPFFKNVTAQIQWRDTGQYIRSTRAFQLDDRPPVALIGQGSIVG